MQIDLHAGTPAPRAPNLPTETSVAVLISMSAILNKHALHPTDKVSLGKVEELLNSTLKQLQLQHDQLEKLEVASQAASAQLQQHAKVQQEERRHRSNAEVAAQSCVSRLGALERAEAAATAAAAEATAAASAKAKASEQRLERLMHEKLEARLAALEAAAPAASPTPTGAVSPSPTLSDDLGCDAGAAFGARLDLLEGRVTEVADTTSGLRRSFEAQMQQMREKVAAAEERAATARRGEEARHAAWRAAVQSEWQKAEAERRDAAAATAEAAAAAAAAATERIERVAREFHESVVASTSARVQAAVEPLEARLSELEAMVRDGEARQARRDDDANQRGDELQRQRHEKLASRCAQLETNLVSVRQEAGAAATAASSALTAVAEAESGARSRVAEVAAALDSRGAELRELCSGAATRPELAAGLESKAGHRETEEQIGSLREEMRTIRDLMSRLSAQASQSLSQPYPHRPPSAPVAWGGASGRPTSAARAALEARLVEEQFDLLGDDGRMYRGSDTQLLLSSPSCPAGRLPTASSAPSAAANGSAHHTIVEEEASISPRACHPTMDSMS